MHRHFPLESGVPGARIRKLYAIVDERWQRVFQTAVNVRSLNSEFAGGGSTIL